MIIPSITHLHALVVWSATTDVEAGNTSTSDSCDNIHDCRTLFQIVWSCVSVLIACTWVSVHPNVPGPHDSSWKVFLRKIGLMIIALIAPEMLVLWASRQWFAARKLSERYPGWTRTHAFFALMGGFALYDGNECYSALRFRSFAAHLDLIGRISKAEIKDRSHSDGFSKLIAVMQTTWFMVQLLARWIEGLPVTELEVMTLAFAAMNVLIYFFWWDKPQGVGCHVRIVRKSADEHVVDQPGASPQQNVEWMLSTWSWLCGVLGNSLKVVHNFLDQPVKDILLSVLSIPLFIIFAIFDLAQGILPLVQAIFEMIGRGAHDNYQYSTKVSSFERTIELEPKNAQDKFIAYGAAVMFGAIHCAAWTYKFPSTAEGVLWKVCSLLVTCAPMYLALYDIIENTTSKSNLVEVCLSLVYIGTVFLYILARLSLIVQPFVALRDLPPGIFKAVQWTNFIPHI
ncbi:hypothetical protein GYMLUDRAFT_178157 [Collybiopsis luxurians FD-317 M1]|uniref:Uncharacterized protein n=1 Tax=Collybiopsis luxurians FD-317 M1 TaxID=944289 RepID=A0A0D0ATV7_9AGAR|nr:hypothetical protein GYMLUDRAFT_178157 [Collybiopsis luxurians FD-317 M1]